MALLLALGTSAGLARALPPPSGTTQTTQTAQVEFDEGFLNQQAGSRVDIKRFNQGNTALPGTYLAEFFVNGQGLGRADVTLRQTGPNAGDVQPCMTSELLGRANLDLQRLSPQAAARLANPTSCLILAELVADASAIFDNGEQRLDLSIPQIALARSLRGYVDPKYWDNGVPAMIVQYHANLYRNRSGGIAFTQGYVGLNLGLNAGPWRLRHTGSYSRNNNGSGQITGGYRGTQTNVQRAIVPLSSWLTIGDTFTDGTLFESVGFRGVRLTSDDRMVPESQRGYAPVVRGIAASNARVQIRQNGNLIYETTVAPGSFEISDLYPTGYGGNLEVTVTEANGKSSVFTVPYAAAVSALRPGVTRFDLAVGQYRIPATSIGPVPYLVQGTVQRGFTNLLTGYGGLSFSQGYAAALVGAALNTRYGAFGMDLTVSRTVVPYQPNRRGHSLRLAYSKLIAPTKTNVSLAAYRYSSSGYLRLADAVALRDLSTDSPRILRSQLQLTVSQALAAGYGSFYLSGSSQNYWNHAGRDTQFQAGYSNSYRRVNYSLSMSRQFYAASAQWDNRFMLTLGLPLGGVSQSSYASTSVQKDPDSTGVQQSLSGALGTDNAFSYSLNAGHTNGNGDRNTSASANATYTNAYSTLNVSASGGNGYSQQGAGASGTIVAYGGGVAISSSSGDTYAVIEAPSAGGARLPGTIGGRVSPWGRALVTTLSPFARNAVSLDPNGLPMSVEIKATEQQAIPTAGAVVRVRFETTNTGRTAVFQAKTAAGDPLPFGADVTDAQGNPVGTVSQAGRFIARGLTDDSGRFNIVWGTGSEERCAFNYQLPPASKNQAATGLSVIKDVCRDPASIPMIAGQPGRSLAK